MHPFGEMRRGGAPGDDVQLGILFRDDDVVDVLLKPLLVQVEARLDRVDAFDSRQGADHIAVVQAHLGGGRVLVGVDGHQFPVIVLNPVVLFQSLANRNDLDAFLFGLAVDDGGVFLKEGPAAFLLVYIHSGHHQALPLRLGQRTKFLVRKVVVGNGTGLEFLQIDIRPDRRLLVDGFGRSFLQFSRIVHRTHSSYPISAIHRKISRGLVLQLSTPLNKTWPLSTAT